MRKYQTLSVFAAITIMTMGLTACEDAPESRQIASGDADATIEENVAPEAAQAPVLEEAFDQNAIPAAEDEITEVIDNMEANASN